MNIRQTIIAGLASATLLAGLGCAPHREEVIETKQAQPAGTSAGTVQFVVNGQGHAILDVEAGQTIVWSAEHQGDTFEIRFPHSQPCVGESSSIRSDPQGRVTCTLKQGYQFFKYETVINTGGQFAVRVPDCRDCPINSGYGKTPPPPPPGGSPSPAARSNAVEATTSQPSVSNASDSGIAFFCMGSAPAFTNSPVTSISRSELPTIRVWAPDGVSSAWKIHFNAASPCAEGVDLSSNDAGGKFRCTILPGTGGTGSKTYAYSLQAAACGSGTAAGTINIGRSESGSKP